MIQSDLAIAIFKKKDTEVFHTQYTRSIFMYTRSIVNKSNHLCYCMGEGDSLTQNRFYHCQNVITLVPVCYGKIIFDVEI